jgi:polyphenol oxidase
MTQRINIPNMRKDGFILRESQGVRYYTCKAFENIPRLGHGFSTREGRNGQSLNLSYRPWDSVERVHENRQLFLSAVHLDGSNLAILRQVHSNRAYIIEDKPGEWNPSEGDALITAVEKIALAVQIADCLPVLIADPVKRVVAAVHSGWKGTLSRILFHTIEKMQRSCSSRPSDLLVAVGPGIRECCFEVGHEVAELFEKEFPGSNLAVPVEARPGKFLLDLVKALEIQLDIAGVQVENRYDLGACTRCNPDQFFSHRAEGPASGRMLAVIGLAGEMPCFAKEDVPKLAQE